MHKFSAAAEAAGAPEDDALMECDVSSVHGEFDEEASELSNSDYQVFLQATHIRQATQEVFGRACSKRCLVD